MATWRLRRLYHAEAGFYTYKTKDTLDSKKRRNLDDASHLGLVADWSNKTLDMFSRQEARLERSFYRALHELQRLRKERQSNLALLSQETPVGQVPDLPQVERGMRLQPAASRLISTLVREVPSPQRSGDAPGPK